MKLLSNGGGGRFELPTFGVMSPTYFPCKPLIVMALTSDVTRLVSPSLTVFRCNTCYNYNLKLTDISSDFRDTNITLVTKSGNFL